MASQDPRYREASRRVAAKINFCRFLGLYLILSVFFWVIAFMTNGGWWPIWYMVGAGFGLAWMAYNAFMPQISEEERQRMIEDEMRRNR